MAEQLFRKVSLERLSSPEQLDLLMQVTTPKGWVALLAMGGLLASAVLWGIIGSIPTRVTGQGILVRTGGVFDIPATSPGMIRDLYVSPGDLLDKGQIVARVSQPSMLDALKTAKEKLTDLQSKYDLITRTGSEEMQLEVKSMAQQRANLQSNITALEGRTTWLNEKVANQKTLLEDGLITKQQLLSAEQELKEVFLEIETKKEDLHRVDIRELQLNAQGEEETAEIERQINECKRNIKSLQENLDASSKVLSPYTGRILEVPVAEGFIVERGESLAKGELLGKEIKNHEAITYFSAGDGKKIQVGMNVNISPSTVQQSEYGCLLGIVTHVSDFPATPQAMRKTLQNDTLVQDLSSMGAPIEVRADLIPDPTTPSGYKWTSAGGPPIRLETGTVCGATVSVREQRPITLVLPWLKENFLGVGQTAK